MADELQRRRHVQDREGAGNALPARPEDEATIADDRLLPDWRAVEPDVVCAEIFTWFWQREKLRRLLDGVGQLRTDADRARECDCRLSCREIAAGSLCLHTRLTQTMLFEKRCIAMNCKAHE